MNSYLLAICFLCKHLWGVIQDIADVDEKLAEGKESKVDDVNGDGVKDLLDGGFLIEVEGREARASVL